MFRTSAVSQFRCCIFEVCISKPNASQQHDKKVAFADFEVRVLRMQLLNWTHVIYAAKCKCSDLTHPSIACLHRKTMERQCSGTKMYFRFAWLQCYVCSLSSIETWHIDSSIASYSTNKHCSFPINCQQQNINIIIGLKVSFVMISFSTLQTLFLLRGWD